MLSCHVWRIFPLGAIILSAGTSTLYDCVIATARHPVGHKQAKIKKSACGHWSRPSTVICLIVTHSLLYQPIAHQ